MAKDILTDHEANVFQEAFHAGLHKEKATGFLSPEDAEIFHAAFEEGLKIRQMALSSQ